MSVKNVTAITETTNVLKMWPGFAEPQICLEILFIYLILESIFAPNRFAVALKSATCPATHATLNALLAFDINLSLWSRVRMAKNTKNDIQAEYPQVEYVRENSTNDGVAEERSNDKWNSTCNSENGDCHLANSTSNCDRFPAQHNRRKYEIVADASSNSTKGRHFGGDISLRQVGSLRLHCVP